VAKTKLSKFPNNTITTAKIANETVVNADVSPSAAIVQSKVDSLSTTLTDTTAINDTNSFNIGLIGFKMAVNDSLTVFNLIDGVVDEFNDESGTDEAEGSNDLYCGTSDYYTNQVLAPACFSAGFTTTTVTEPDTSVAVCSPGYYQYAPHPATQTSCGQYVNMPGSFGTYTVPTGMTSATLHLWGSGGGGAPGGPGGGGGYTQGTLAVSASQVLHINVGKGGSNGAQPMLEGTVANVGGGNSGYSNGAGGGGLTGVFSVNQEGLNSTPEIYAIAGSGGGGGDNGEGGAGGGTTAEAGSDIGAADAPAQTSLNGYNGGGGGQSVGGEGGQILTNAYPAPLADAAGYNPAGGPYSPDLLNGFFLQGGSGAAYSGGGGGGYYGGGGGGLQNFSDGGGGGGSGYTGNPQLSSTTNSKGTGVSGAGTPNPNYIPGTNEGGAGIPATPGTLGEDGYVLITGSGCAYATSSTTIVSEAFTSTSVATNARIVVFEEDVDSPTLNTDIIASVSRDGTNFTNATLSDSGYITGSSGQRILTGQVDISGQPSGQSMRWKLALANNQVKIHGVSLSWS
jgi:hypothetical protein